MSEIQKIIIGNLLLQTNVENQKALSDLLILDFFEGDNKTIINLIKEQNQKGFFADVKLLKYDNLDYLISCLAQSTSVNSLKETLQELKQEYLERTLPNLKNFNDLDKIKVKILEIEKNSQILDATNSKTIQDVLIDSIESSRNSLVDLENLPKTGFSKFDEIFGGFMGGQVCTVGGYSGVGKSTFLFSLIRNLGIEYEMLIVNLEMKNEIMTARILSALSSVPLIYTANLGSPKTQECLVRYHFQEKIEKGLNALDKIKLKMVDNAYNIESIIQIIRKEKEKNNLKFVLIDYLQLIQNNKVKRDQRHLEIGEITRDLKILAQELNVTIILLAQLGRSSLNREEPQLNDLRESGSIEMDSDLVFLLHRNKAKDTEIILAKDRMFGKYGKATLNYNLTTQSYQ